MKKVCLLVIATLLPLLAPTWSPPVASAAGCPNVEVVWARGTGEPPGLGDMGEQFVSDLSSRIGPVGTYAVDYPASMDFGPSALAGVNDAANYIQWVANNCPGTEIILGGYSQGAAVAGFVTSAVIPDGAPADAPQPMDGWVAGHVHAVVLVGSPNPAFMAMFGQPVVSVGPAYAWKTIQLCNDGDPVCSDNSPGVMGGDWALHTNYGDNGMVAQGAAYAAARV